MTQDILFILPPDFADADATWYCRECAEVVGLLALYPQLHDLLDVRMIAYAKPRMDILDVLGPGAPQNCPMLIALDASAIDGVDFVPVRNRMIVDGALQIGRYLAARFGIGGPHP
jgi:hypothetical protein